MLSKDKYPMGKVRVTTETGSIYLIDFENKTWERLNKTGESGPTRTESGDILNEVPLVIHIGQSINISTNKIDQSATIRLISTSKVISVENV